MRDLRVRSDKQAIPVCSVTPRASLYPTLKLAALRPNNLELRSMSEKHAISPAIGKGKQGKLDGGWIVMYRISSTRGELLYLS